ncbi:hypothetical protein RND71_040073 [Anisodus tanguticus]|uniref:Uncharacterized protein n=1 Tax=Anisodus tanguticus TaxID=243964 RepID=A0AAE1USK2_9SOLA|nr:hypothetical protein RND71_040073 [Anisodus tanguticus]
MAKTTQSQTFFVLLFICLLMNISPSSGNSTMQVHPQQSTATATDAANDTTTTMTTTMVNAGGTGTASQQYYGVAAHEVPSGANPESNR